MTTIKERLKVCGLATVMWLIQCFDSHVPCREVKLAEFGPCPDHQRSMDTGYMSLDGRGGRMRIECLPRGKCYLSIYISPATGMMFFYRKPYCSSLFIYTCCYTPISDPPTNRCSFVKIVWGYTVLREFPQSFCSCSHCL